MFDFLYRLNYDDQLSITGDASQYNGRLTINARVYAIAEKYGVWSLKDTAIQKSADILKQMWNTNDLFTAIEIVWTSTPGSDRGLRECYLAAIVKHKHDLHKMEGFMEFVRSIDDMAGDILDAEWNEVGKSPFTIFCQTCRVHQRVFRYCGYCGGRT